MFEINNEAVLDHQASNKKASNGMPQHKPTDTASGSAEKLKKAFLSDQDNKINHYLLLVSRLETSVTNQNIEAFAANQFLDELVQKLSDLSEKNILILEKTNEYLSLNLDLRSINKKLLILQMENEQTRENLFKFLYSKPLMAILNDEPQALNNYHKNNSTSHKVFSGNLLPPNLNQKIGFVNYNKQLNFSV